MTKVLRGIRVLDFGRYIAGPFCGTLLGDMGAEVIRVEKVDGSEDRFLSPISDSGDGALFMQLARNKLGMTLNPMKPEGQEIVKKLVATADVVIANLPPDTLQRMGLDYDSLAAIKADIILTTVSAFGRGGPYANRVGFDGLGQAMSGAMYLSGTPEQPTKAYPPF
ncbi:MAG: CoA transferase, partial [Pseudohongiellaceae bacterium]